MTRKLHRIASVILITFITCISAHISMAQDVKPTAAIAPSQYVVPKMNGVTTKVLSDGNALAITADGSQKEIIIPLERMEVQPNTTYHARYQLRAAALEQNANVYLLLREHKDTKSRPIPPYQKESIRVRDLKVKPNDKWVKRQLDITTKADTHALSGSLVISQLKGTLHLSRFELWSDEGIAAQAQLKENEGKATFEKAMDEVRAQAATRQQVAPRTLVFSRSQIKYDLGRNYYHTWTDRPLLANRDYRVPSPYIAPLSSYKRTLEEVLNYDMDGLAFFPENKDRMATFKEHAEANVPGVQLLPEFMSASYTAATYGWNDDNAELKAKTEAIQNALKSTFTPRINGKVLITSYRAEGLKPEQWKVLLAALRQRVGDTFLFVPALDSFTGSTVRADYKAKGWTTPVEIEKAKAFLRSYLDVTDGIYFNYPPAFYLDDHTFDVAYYRDVMIPIFKSVLAEPQYRHKLLGLSAYKSHVNPDRGNNLWQDGTRTLRNTFQTAMDAKPDVMVLPEWDEQNENTSWRPTVYGARSNERIVRYYMSEIKQKKPSPVPGDDTTIPNLTLSTRKIAVIGENLMIELLNIPDGSQGKYTAQLILQDENDKTIKTYNPLVFDSTKLEEHRLYLPTETIPQVRALNPVLKITGYKGHDFTFDTGFHATQLRATWNWDFLYVNQPLRDIMHPVKATIAWEKPAQKDGTLILTGSISAPDDLNTVEILGDDDEVYAVDPKKEFFRDDPNRELIYIDYRSQYNSGQEIDGTLTLKNATAEWITQGNILHQEDAEEHINGQTLQLKSPVSPHVRWIYLAVPKKDIEKGELDFNFDKAKFTVPLKVLLEKQILSYPFSGSTIFTIKNYHRQIDMPLPLKTKSASFSVQIQPEISTEQYHLRATSIDGRIYRTRPLLIPASEQVPNKTLRVYAESQKRGVDVQVAANRIPDLNYEFDPSHGAMLFTNAGVPFDGTLGGFTDSTTGRGTPPAIFIGKGKFNLPANAGVTAPKWVTENGASALQFDGKQTFAVLPREALPFKGSFTLSFDVKPDSAADQALLIHYSHPRRRGLQLSIQNGTLKVLFQNAAPSTISLDTKLAIPPGKWSHIKVQHNFEKLSITVNGKTASIDSPLPASNIGSTVIGAGLGTPWFEGQLKNLEIVHNARPMTAN